MLPRFLSSSLPRTSVLGSSLTSMSYRTTPSQFSLNKEDLKIAMDECEGLPIHRYFSVDDAAKLPKNFLLTSKTWKTPVKRFFWVPLLAFVPSGCCTMICLGGGYWIAKLIPHPMVQNMVKSVKGVIPRFGSAITLKDPNPKEGESKEFCMDFFHKNSCMKFSKEDIANVEVVTRRTILGHQMKVVKLTIKMKNAGDGDLENVDFQIGADNDWEAELICKCFEE